MPLIPGNVSFHRWFEMSDLKKGMFVLPPSCAHLFWLIHRLLHNAGCSFSAAGPQVIGTGLEGVCFVRSQPWWFAFLVILLQAVAVGGIPASLTHFPFWLTLGTDLLYVCTLNVSHILCGCNFPVSTGVSWCVSWLGLCRKSPWKLAASAPFSKSVWEFSKVLTSRGLQ